MAFGTLAIASRSVITDVKTNSQGLFLCLSKNPIWQIYTSDKEQSFDAITSNKDPNKIFQ